MVHGRLKDAIARRWREGVVVFAAGVILVLLWGCRREEPQALPRADISVAGHRVTVEIAATPAARRRGLMGRRSLPKNHGMLFVYPTDEYLSFWMRGTSFAISLAFVRANGDIIQIVTMSPNTTTPHQSSAPVRYALEMPAGWFEQHGVRPGDRVIIPPDISANE